MLAHKIFFAIALLIPANIVVMFGMEKPRRFLKQTPEQIKRAVEKDRILQAALKELEIHSGRRTLKRPTTIFVTNNFKQPVRVGPESVKIMPGFKEKIKIDFSKISNRLGYFALEIYDKSDALIATLNGYRNECTPGHDDYTFSTSFETFYNNDEEPIHSDSIEAPDHYCVNLTLGGNDVINGSMQLYTIVKNSAGSTIPLYNEESPRTMGSKAEKTAPQRPTGSISACQSTTCVEIKRSGPVFPAPKRLDEEQRKSGSLIGKGMQTLRAINRTGSLINVKKDISKEA